MADPNAQIVLDMLADLSGPDDPDAVARRYVADDHVDHFAPHGAGGGPEHFAQTIRSLRAGFPDLRQVVEDVIGEGDRVVVRTRFTGTHDGPFRGMAPTGRPVDFTQIHIFRVADGLLREHWACIDEMTAIRQVGMAPGPRAAVATA